MQASGLLQSVGKPSTLNALATYRLHCSSFFELPYSLLDTELVKPKQGAKMETIGKPRTLEPHEPSTQDAFYARKPIWGFPKIGDPNLVP